MNLDDAKKALYLTALDLLAASDLLDTRYSSERSYYSFDEESGFLLWEYYRWNGDYGHTKKVIEFEELQETIVQNFKLLNAEKQAKIKRTIAENASAFSDKAFEAWTGWN